MRDGRATVGELLKLNEEQQKNFGLEIYMAQST